MNPFVLVHLYELDKGFCDVFDVVRETLKGTSLHEVETYLHDIIYEFFNDKLSEALEEHDTVEIDVSGNVIITSGGIICGESTCIDVDDVPILLNIFDLESNEWIDGDYIIKNVWKNVLVEVVNDMGMKNNIKIDKNSTN